MAEDVGVPLCFFDVAVPFRALEVVEALDMGGLFGVRNCSWADFAFVLGLSPCLIANRSIYIIILELKRTKQNHESKQSCGCGWVIMRCGSRRRRV